jgi:hypothetical protein
MFKCKKVIRMFLKYVKLLNLIKPFDKQRIKQTCF